MIKFVLRDYQEKAVHKATDAVRIGQNPLLILPTGAGKSLIISELTKKLSDRQILVITPRIKLLQQNAKLIDNAGILSGRLGKDTGENHRVICGTYQTLIKKEFVPPDIIIIDEAHLVPHDDSEYSDLLAKFPKARIIGLTATPFRAHSTIYEHSTARWRKTYEIGLLELIKNGYLVPPKSFKTHIEIDANNASDDEITLSILPAAIEKMTALNRHKILVFCRDIEHAEFTTKALVDLGCNALCIHSNMTQLQHKAIYKSFDNSDDVFLVSCNMLTTGVDLPAADGLILIRKISMGALYIQIVGRGLRAAPGKDYCAVLDYGKNINRFGRLDDPNFLKDASTRTGKVDRFKHCEQCELLLPLSATECSHCGYQYPKKTVLEIESSSAQMLSIDLRQSKIIECNIDKMTDNSYRVLYQLENGDKTFKFVSSYDHAKELKNNTGIALYRVSRGISQLIMIK